MTSPNRVSNTGSGVNVYNDLNGSVQLSYVRIDHVTVSGFYQGIFVGGTPSDNSQSGYKDVRITNTTAYNNAMTEITIQSSYDESTFDYGNSNIYIGNCIAHDNLGVPGFQNWSGSGIFVSQTDTGTIEYNTAYNNGALNDYAGAGPVGIWAAAANNIMIQHNESHHNKTATIDGDGFDLDGGSKNSIMQYNYSHDNMGSGYLVDYYGAGPGMNNENLTVRYNLSQNDGVGSSGYGGIYVYGTMTTPTYIYNNTIYSDAAVVGSSAVLIDYNGATNTVFSNNIFMEKA